MRGKNKSIIKVFIYIFPLCYTSMHRRYKERCKIVASSSSELTTDSKALNKRAASLLIFLDYTLTHIVTQPMLQWQRIQWS